MHADNPIDEVFGEIQEALQTGGGPLVIIRKSAQEIERMARAGARRRRDARARRRARSRPASRLRELDELAEEFIRSQGGVPTFMGYRGFPASLCLSPNDMVVHGIPGEYSAWRRATSSRSTSA